MTKRQLEEYEKLIQALTKPTYVYKMANAMSKYSIFKPGQIAGARTRRDNALKEIKHIFEAFIAGKIDEVLEQQYQMTRKEWERLQAKEQRLADKKNRRRSDGIL